jgi:pseudaminic acid synthase
MKIGHRTIDSDNPVFIVAELSANHNQKLDVAIDIIKAARKAGADAIKLQTYTPDTITIDCDNEYFQLKQGTLWDGKTLYQLYQEAYTPWEWHEELFRIAREEGLICFSTPFDKTAVDFLETLHTPAYKVASFEITDTPLIEYIASKGKPVIISTGIATLEDIEEAIAACRKSGNDAIALLKCTSSYPAPIEEANLKTIPDMARRFRVIAGLSDHTMGIAAAVTAVAFGAKIIEKHFIVDRKLGGPDATFSMEPGEFTLMVKTIREAEKAIGEVTYELSKKMKTRREFARSLFVVEDIRKGETFTDKNVRSIRPGYGLHPKFLKEILNKKAAIDISIGTPLSWKHIS